MLFFILIHSPNYFCALCIPLFRCLFIHSFILLFWFSFKHVFAVVSCRDREVRLRDELKELGVKDCKLTSTTAKGWSHFFDLSFLPFSLSSIHSFLPPLISPFFYSFLPPSLTLSFLPFHPFLSLLSICSSPPTILFFVVRDRIGLLSCLYCFLGIQTIPTSDGSIQVNGTNMYCVVCNRLCHLSSVSS